MKKLICVAVLLPLLVMFFAPVQAQEDEEIKKHPGYINFDDINIPDDAEESVEVYVRGPLLKLVAHATKREDPALSDLLTKLLLVRVNTFSIERGEINTLSQKINKIESSLGDKKWEKVARVKERDDLVNVYMKMDDEKIVGLVVMAIEEDKEAVFVNIVGEIDMDAIGKLGRKFDIPTLDTWDEEKHTW